jgi:hypothetical protein
MFCGINFKEKRNRDRKDQEEKEKRIEEELAALEERERERSHFGLGDVFSLGSRAFSTSSTISSGKSRSGSSPQSNSIHKGISLYIHI